MRCLDDLAPNFQLHLVCAQCRRMVPAPLALLRQRFGNLAIADVAGRTRCRICGSRPEGVRLIYAAVGGHRRPGVLPGPET